MDYASHVIDLINHLVAPVKEVEGTLLKSIYSQHVDDAVYSFLKLSDGVSGLLSVNWSDDTYRKWSTSVSIMGTAGKIVSDASELKVYFKKDVELEGYTKGWNVKYVTDRTDPWTFTCVERNIPPRSTISSMRSRAQDPVRSIPLQVPYLPTKP